MRKGFYIFLVLLLLVSPCISYSLEITEKQMKELTAILQEYTNLTSELKTTLTKQKQTLEILKTKSETQQMIIQQLSQSFQKSNERMKDLESSYLKYKRIQMVKDYILYGTIIALTGGLIAILIVK